MGNLTCTASGSVANFYTPYAVPIRSFKVYFSPKQSGTGDPSPENVRPIEGWTGVTGYRCGKNLLNEDPEFWEQGAWGVDGPGKSASTTRIRTKQLTPIKPGSTVTISVSDDSFMLALGAYDGIGLSGITRLLDSGWTTNATVTIPETGVGFSVHLRKSDNSNIDPTALSEVKIQVEYGTQSTVHEPYHFDEIPISFPAYGKNLFDGNLIQGNVNADGATTDTVSRIRTGFIPIGAGTYTLSFDNNFSCALYVFSSNQVGSQITSESNSNWSGSPFTFTITNGKYYIVKFKHNTLNSITPNDLTDVQLELGSISTEYEVYKGNTFYGGYVDLVSGEVVETDVVFNFDGTESWDGSYISNPSDSTRFTVWLDSITGIAQYGVGSKTKCSHLVYGESGTTVWGEYRYNPTSGNPPRTYFSFPDANLQHFTGLDNFKEWLASEYQKGTPLQLMTPLLEPVTHTLSPQTLSTLTHSNAFWSNADSVEIEYDLAECGDIKEIRRRILLNTPYIFLDHIASPNAAAKINSGVFGDDDTLEFDLCFSVDAYLQYNAIFGNYIDEETNCWRLIQGSSDIGRLIVGTNTRAGSGGSIRVYDDSYVNKKIHIVINNNKITSTVDGVTREIDAPTVKGTTNNTEISIGSSGIRNVYGSYKKTWYWVKISQNGILIRDYRPCYSLIDYKYGFFDVVSKTFNPSNGGTDFTAN